MGGGGRLRSRIRTTFLVTLAILSFLVLYSWWHIFIVIPPGYAGVRYSLFFAGTADNVVYGEGLHVQWPWNSVRVYDVRLTSRSYKVEALSLGGLAISVDVTVFARPSLGKLAELNRELGPDYFEKIVEPAISGGVRDVVGKITGDQLHLLANQELESRVLDEAISECPVDLVQLAKVVIRRVELPQQINEAIDYKLAEEQRAQAYTYILQSVEGEAARRRIEAAGIRDFQTIIGSSLTPALLTWHGIEATLQLAKSGNAKVVIVGNSSKDLPLILGSDLFKTSEALSGEKPEAASPAAQAKPAEPAQAAVQPQPATPAQAVTSQPPSTPPQPAAASQPPTPPLPASPTQPATPPQTLLFPQMMPPTAPPGRQPGAARTQAGRGQPPSPWNVPSRPTVLPSDPFAPPVLRDPLGADPGR
jgi:regulator of protease activity HflC (stomatin/prohibitin superfamily)